MQKSHLTPEIQEVHHSVPEIQEIINRVGVGELDFPLVIRTKKESITVDATLEMFGSLFSHRKGIDMSRFPEVLQEYLDVPFTEKDFFPLLERLKTRVGAPDVYVAAHFKLYVPKEAPVTKKKSYVGYVCSLTACLKRRQERFFYKKVSVPVASVCPCSKDMCLVDRARGLGKGAHNQRAIITAQVRCDPEAILLEDMIERLERCGSAPVYTLLKRPDEKYITMYAYENPKFVEDIIREAYIQLRDLPTVQWLRIKAESMESIHNHLAIAYLEREKRGDKWLRTDKGFT